MKRKTHPANGARRGVALIVVLGFLSIMILMALAFLTQARTERLVADATLEAQRGRQMVRTALAAAMNDYSVALFPPSGNRYMLPPDTLKVFYSIPPTADVDMNRTLKDDNLLLLNGEARQWIPRVYLNDPAVTNPVNGSVSKAEWILVREDPTDRNSRILGRYAYVCFDMSGGMDANLIALTSGAANNGIAISTNPAAPIARASVRDVGMGELDETANASEFKRLRSGWHGFDSLAELILLTNGKYNGGEQEYEDEADDNTTWGPPASPRWQGDRVERYGAALVSSKVTDLVPYSLAAFRGVYTIASEEWEAPQLCDAAADWNKALNPLVEGGQIAAAQVPDMVKAIQDYIRPGVVPTGVDYPSVKNVPMFNELGWKLELLAPTLTNLALRVTHDYEFWYPFPSDDNPGNQHTFELTAPAIGGGYAASGTGDIWMRLRIRRGNTQVNLVAKGSPTPAQLTLTEDYNGGKPKSAGTIVYDFDVVPVNPSNTLNSADTLQIASIKVQKPIQLMLDTAPADQMDLDVGQSLDLVVGTPMEFSYEVDDPRLNHVKNRWTLADPASPDEINPTARSAGYEAPGGEGKYLYCRNGAMKTPAELGFIPTGKAWETIDLCTAEGADMLSRLVADKIVRDTVVANGTYYTNGTINPNSSSTNVLMSAFAGLSMREVPNADVLDLDALPDEDARALAAAMIFASRTKRLETDGGAFMTGLDWLRTPGFGDGGDLANKGYNENQRESLIRNTWGLFSPNNSLFTVLVVGQAIKEGPGKEGVWDANEDVITGERRGVALVWRDPIPTAKGGPHEMFVRMFKFLDE